jgi:hypothetical protein
VASKALIGQYIASEIQQSRTFYTIISRYIPTCMLWSQDAGLLLFPEFLNKQLKAGLSPIELNFYGIVYLSM